MTPENSKRVLVISPVATHPPHSGNASRILRLCEQIIGLGHEVHFLHLNFETGNDEAMRAYWDDRFHSYSWQNPWNHYKLFGVPIPDKLSVRLLATGWLSQTIDQFHDPHLIPWLKQHSLDQDFDAVFVEYVFFSKALKLYDSSTLKIIDTHDIYTDRHKLLIKQGKYPDWFFTTSTEERKGLQRADIVLAIQNKEHAFFEDLIQSGTRVETVGHIIKIDPTPPPESLKKLMFLGSNNAINSASINTFLKQTWPDILRSFPKIELHIYGNICKALHSVEGVHLKGFAPNPATPYRQCDVVINPIQKCTGLNIKSIEALAHGKPFVTSTHGAEGLESGIDNAFLIADSTEDWIEQIKKLTEAPSELSRLAKGAESFARNYLNKQTQTLERILNSSATSRARA